MLLFACEEMREAQQATKTPGSETHVHNSGISQQVPLLADTILAMFVYIVWHDRLEACQRSTFRYKG